MSTQEHPRPEPQLIGVQWRASRGQTGATCDCLHNDDDDDDDDDKNDDNDDDEDTANNNKGDIDFRVYLHCNLNKCINAPSLSVLRSFLYPSFPCTHICLFWPVFVWLVSFHSLSHTSGKRVLAASFPFQLRNCWESGEWLLSAAEAGGGGAVERMLVKVEI